MRPSWDEYFMNIVELVKTRSTCLRRQVGALIVKDKRILASGYNGAPVGCKHCAEIGCLRDKLGIPSGQRHELCRATHAEQNAIVQAAYSGTSVRDSVMYVTTQPCVLCAQSWLLMPESPRLFSRAIILTIFLWSCCRRPGYE